MTECVRFAAGHPNNWQTASEARELADADYEGEVWVGDEARDQEAAEVERVFQVELN